MIKVVLNDKGITLSGHANFADYGKDIVCASVSSIICSSVNDMMSVNEKAVYYKDDGNTIEIKILKEDKLVLKLFSNLTNLLISLSNDYPKNIKIESRD